MIGISQDDQAATNHFTQQLATAFPVQRDSGLALSRRFDLTFVPSLFLIDHNGRVLRSHFGFDKAVLNEIANQMRCPPVAEDFDGAPQSKPGCMSRHLEPKVELPPAALYATFRPQLSKFLTAKIYSSIASGILATRCR